MRQPYPVADASRIDAAAVSEMEWVKQFIVGVRQIRSGMNIPPGKPLPVLLQNASAEDRERLTRNRAYIDFLARRSFKRLSQQPLSDCLRKRQHERIFGMDPRKR